jgi:hypothetical protein
VGRFSAGILKAEATRLFFSCPGKPGFAALLTSGFYLKAGARNVLLFLLNSAKLAKI